MALLERILRTLFETILYFFTGDTGSFNRPPPTVPPTLPPNVVPEPPAPPVVPQDVPKPPVPTPAPPKPSVPLLGAFCLAIQSREGYFKPGENPAYPHGTPSYRNNNPGNIKQGPFAKGCGSIGLDASGFAVFPSYATGFTALETLVRNAASGKSDLYQPTWTILQFFQTYAPAADKNDPISYAKEVAKKLGVDYQTFIIRNLL